MAFELKNVVPWGRNMEEYKSMFLLSSNDLKKKIAGFGDGPASFNCEADRLGYDVISFDPLYVFSKKQIAQRIEETKEIVIKQMSENMDNYNWRSIKNIDELEKIRLSAMNEFLEDYEKGKSEGRYICAGLPERINIEKYFDIGLSSHFLLMYKNLGYDFHIKSINEMLRLCKEIRIAPIVDLNGNSSKLTEKVIEYYSKDYNVNVAKTDYDFLKNGNRVLVINRR